MTGVQTCALPICLISLDYDHPLTGACWQAYEGYPIRGSIALTNRGQQVLELLEYQGYLE